MQFLKRSRIGLVVASLAAAAMLITPLLSSADPPAAPAAPVAPAPELSPEQALQIEFLTLRQALAAAEQAALQDPGLQKLHDELQTAIQDAMRAADTEHDAKVARLTELGETLEAAQTTAEEPDMAALEPLMTEAQGIQEQLLELQTKVVEAEPLASRIEQMRTQILAKMSEVDPKVPANLERLEELAKQL